MASMEVIYHMHCLNLLRKSTFYNHEYYKEDPVFDDPVLSAETRISETSQNYERLKTAVMTLS